MYLPELPICLDHVSNRNYNSVKTFAEDRVDSLRKFLSQLKSHNIDGKSIQNSSKFKDVNNDGKILSRDINSFLEKNFAQVESFQCRMREVEKEHVTI